MDNTLDGMIFINKEFKRKLENMQILEKTLDELKMTRVDEDVEEAASKHWNEELNSEDNKTWKYY